jgi:hypothetical protein
MSVLNEIDVLAQNLPLKDHLSKYLCVKTTMKTTDDLEFQIPNGLDKIMHRFGHHGWNELKPLIVGIKCYTTAVAAAAVFVTHMARDGSNNKMIDSFDVVNDTWYTFKYPLLANYHTVTRILLTEGITAYTLAILDTSLRVRHDNGTNEFPPGYRTIGDPYVYSSDNKALVYEDEKGNLINPSGAEKMFVVK